VSRPTRISSDRLHRPTNQAIIVIRRKMFHPGRFGAAESCAESHRIIPEWLAGTSQAPRSSGTDKAVQADPSLGELIRDGTPL
jgi:hypothetical protein